MRPITENEITLLREPHRIQVWPRLYVYHGTNRQDLTARLKSASVDFDPDSGTWGGSFAFNNRDGQLSPGILDSPFNLESGVYAPLFSPFREVEYYEAYTQWGQTPKESDYKWLFHGYLGDEFQAPCAAGEFKIRLRDAFAERASAVEITTEKEYSGTAEAVIQQLLADYGLSTPGVEPDFTLWTPIASQYLITPENSYKTVGVNLLDAIQKVANARGWIVSYRFNPVIGKWRPCLWYPSYDRTGTFDFSVALNDVEDDSNQFSAADLRNSVQIALADGSYVLRKNEASIQKYSPLKRNGTLDRVERYMGLVEETASPIDTVAEADRLAQLILHETAFIRGTRAIPFSGPMWHLEFGDLLGITNRFLDNELTNPQPTLSSTPRFVLGPDAVYTEGTANLLSGKTNFQTSWLGFGGATATITQGRTDPTGGAGATRIQTSGGTDALKWLCSAGTGTNGTNNSTSLWVKNNSAVSVKIHTNQGGLSRTVLQSEGWVKVELYPTLSNGVGDRQIQLRSDNAANNLDIDAWQPQIEEHEHPTPFIESMRQDLWTSGPMGRLLRVEEGTANLFTANQASIETDLTGLSAINGATIARDTTAAWQGAASLKTVTPGTSAREGFTTSNVAVTSGLKYALSVYVKGSGAVLLSAFDGISAPFDSSPVVLNGHWQRLTLVVTPASAVLALRVLTSATAQAITFQADGLQIEQKAYATSWQMPGTARSSEYLSCPLTGLSLSEGFSVDIKFLVTANAVRKVASQWPSVFHIKRADNGDTAIWLYHEQSSAGYRLQVKNDASTLMTSPQIADSVYPVGGVTHFRILVQSGASPYAAVWGWSASGQWVELAKVTSPPFPSGLGAAYLGSTGSASFLNTDFAEFHLRRGLDYTVPSKTERLPVDGSTTLYMGLNGNLIGVKPGNKVHMIRQITHETQIGEENVNCTTSATVAQYEPMSAPTPSVPAAPSGLAAEAKWRFVVRWLGPIPFLILKRYILLTWPEFEQSDDTNLILQWHKPSQAYADLQTVARKTVSLEYYPPLDARNMELTFRLKAQIAGGVAYSNEATATLKGDA